MSNAFQMGALAADCNLERSTNPFTHNADAASEWDEGYSKAIHQWRAEQRARIADDYGDDAADLF